MLITDAVREDFAKATGDAHRSRLSHPATPIAVLRHGLQCNWTSWSSRAFLVPMPKTILLADDSPLVGQTLYKFLATEGSCELCAQAGDGDEAVSLAKQCKPDLVILDLAMPKMNGLEAARELKKIMPTIPIILFTLHATAVKESFAQEWGIDLVVPKGDFARLMEHVRMLLLPAS